MPPDLFEVSFLGNDRRYSLLAARKFVNAITGAVSIVRGENVRRDGAVFVVVHGEEADVRVSLMGKEVEGVAVLIVPTAASEGIECVNCGNRTDGPFVRCPACEFREIGPCPVCGNEVPRTEYPGAEAELLRCPKCSTRVRLVYADPAWTAEGFYAEPLIRVERA